MGELEFVLVCIWWCGIVGFSIPLAACLFVNIVATYNSIFNPPPYRPIHLVILESDPDDYKDRITQQMRESAASFDKIWRARRCANGI